MKDFKLNTVKSNEDAEQIQIAVVHRYIETNNVAPAKINNPAASRRGMKLSNNFH